ncbi:MAG: hypothetical protein PWP24_113 [Clostridiales bacterium]|nr:hypothetical protein [Clostridiales bacterium]
MYQLKTIGTIETTKEETIICVNQEFKKALKYVEEFSHIHVFLWSKMRGFVK